MSRSRRKHPIRTDNNSSKANRSIANRIYRRKNLEEVPKKSNIHKKYYESYNIHDYSFRWTWEEALREWETDEYLKEKYKTKKEFYRHWYRTIIGK